MSLADTLSRVCGQIQSRFLDEPESFEAKAR